MNTPTSSHRSADNAMRMNMDPPSDTLRPVSGPTSRTTYDDGSEWRKVNAQRSKERERVNTPWPTKEERIEYLEHRITYFERRLDEAPWSIGQKQVAKDKAELYRLQNKEVA